MSRAFQTVRHLSTSNAGPNDAFLSEAEERPFLEEKVCVFEKLDGVNVVFHHGDDLEVHLKRAWRDVLGGRLHEGAKLWALMHRDRLLRAIPHGGELVVEWLRYRLSLRYEKLPSLGFAIAARAPDGKPLPYARARKWYARAGIPANEPIFEGRLGDVARVRAMVKGSRYGRATMEGVVVERVTPAAEMWSKWVRKGYTQPAPAELDETRRNGLVR